MPQRQTSMFVASTRDSELEDPPRGDGFDGGDKPDHNGPVAIALPAHEQARAERKSDQNRNQH